MRSEKFVTDVYIAELDGSSSGDTIRGQAEPNFLNGIQGNDTIEGRAGNDEVIGAQGNDSVVGGAGGDILTGDEGADRIFAVDGEADEVSCGGGEDTVFFDQGGLDTLLDPDACEDQRPS